MTCGHRHLYVMLLMLLGKSPCADDNLLMLGDFSSGSLTHWQSREFKNQTQYQVIDDDGTNVLKAESVNSASGLFREQRIDLQKTPILNWRWRVDNALGKINEQSRSGDDYAARIYVVTRGGLAFWRTKAINYVWASTTPKGKPWPNAFAGDNVMMMALRSSDDKIGTWYTEKRNVLADFKQQFHEDIPYVDAVAIMTDTDNTQSKATAYYGDIYFSKN
ncbi:conserved exported hypothetical protein [Crenothrix polyspora]|uniref:DUF3047 domain-containing protein n=1 Tax=Crenothrix polyspora TaxID=360316 RepID=A0A1R4HJ97_9GAMM|nr:DUF3047 domain-containing protein [Crenothrix polyspora]SJM96295.1 conserved exported hypothetical protein [Crenothrix polyspora]